MASTDATALPVKNQAYRATFPIFDADGDLVTGAAGLDSEVSKDGGTFADATSEATEIATASGMYYLDLTATEMNADTVAVIVKTSTTGAKTTPMVLYPQETTDLKVNVTHWNGTAVTAPNTAGTPVVDVTRWLGTTAVTPGTAGVPSVDTIRWATQAVPTPAVTGVPKADTTTWAGTAVATPGTAGVPSVDAIRWATQIIPTPAVTGVPKTDEAYRLGVAAIADLPSSTSGTLASATGTTATLVSPASTVASYYVGALLYITGGTGAGQVRRITAYTTGRVATVAAWSTSPDNTSTYEVLPDYVLIADYQSGLATSAALVTAQADLDDIQTRIPAALVSGRIDSSVGAMASGVVTATAVAADAIGASELAADAVTEIAAGVLTVAMTEAYPADGATMTVAQSLYLIAQSIGEFSVSGTTITVKKLDGSATAATYTLDSATTPTSRTRAS